MRPLSGSGSLGIVTELIQSRPDSFLGRLAASAYGSTETTFYVLAVYVGARDQENRHAVIGGLVADVTSLIAAIIICTFRISLIQSTSPVLLPVSRRRPGL